jgi:hypothetical protein
MASALAYDPALIKRWQSEKDAVGFVPNVSWKDKALSGLANMALVKRQLQRMGAGKAPSSQHSPIVSLIMDRLRLAKLTKQYRAWIGVAK